MLSIDPIRPYLPLVYGAIVVGVVAAFWLQGRVNASLRERVASQARALKTYHDAQRTNLETIGGLQARLTAVVDSMRIERDAAIAAQAAAERKIGDINDELEATKRELADVYEKSATARAWGQMGVDADVAKRLPNPRGAAH